VYALHIDLHLAEAKLTQAKSDHQVDAIEELLDIMARLRSPDGGCPWDLEQDFASIAPYTLEEAYEVSEAIQRNDPDEIRDELGDLLFQVVFHAQMAKEKGWFGFGDVVRAINQKLIRRHPHVFGDEEVTDSAAQTEAWEAHKAKERVAKGEESPSALDNVPLALPALVRGQKLQRRAARLGFDWNETSDVIGKLDEELAELKHALLAEEPASRLQEELGDLLFTCVNLARFLEADAEALMRDANRKFETRFRAVEALAAQRQRDLRDCSLDELERLWQTAKRQLG
jgi:MazG family protein